MGTTQTSWSPADIPDLSGRTAVVTGPSPGGIGFHAALELARRSAQVVLAGRSWAKLDAAEAAIRSEVPGARVEKILLDLADLSSVRAGAAAVTDIGPVDVLVNNAGVMATPYRRTADGLELQLATNHFGPFLLTGLLLPALVESGRGRVVTIASLAHRSARRAPLEVPTVQVGRYRSWGSYARSKLANLLFTAELSRRLLAAGLPVTAVAAHPGLTHSGLISNSGSFGPLSGLAARLYPSFSQGPDRGAWPTLMAATADLPPGSYVGPSTGLETVGPPRLVGRSRLAQDPAAAAALWQLSEQTTQISYP
jgi:NAD(P)-dependent dehydrogenase (short-subunit alcohol dehydrogenase family)